MVLRNFSLHLDEEETVSHDLDHQFDPQLDPQEDQPSQPESHGHPCGNLFGCGVEQGTGVFREDIKDAAVTKRSADRLLHMNEMDRERLDGFLSARGRSRRRLMRASSFMGALAGIGPWFTKLARAADAVEAGTSSGSHLRRRKTTKAAFM
jgi:hypothetical protein